MGYEEYQKELYLTQLAKPYGMILVTGPTGSGKTVSLYTALQLLNDEGKNISTVEDPVEYRLALTLEAPQHRVDETDALALDPLQPLETLEGLVDRGVRGDSLQVNELVGPQTKSRADRRSLLAHGDLEVVGDDVIEGGQNNDKMWGEAGNDSLTGQDGNDKVNGDDQFYGWVFPQLYAEIGGHNLSVRRQTSKRFCNKRSSTLRRWVTRHPWSMMSR